MKRCHNDGFLHYLYLFDKRPILNHFNCIDEEIKQIEDDQIFSSVFSFTIHSMIFFFPCQQRSLVSRHDNRCLTFSSPWPISLWIKSFHFLLSSRSLFKMTSYKEAQERLLKWCQHVTKNYEVRRISISSSTRISSFSQSKFAILPVILPMV